MSDIRLVPIDGKRIYCAETFTTEFIEQWQATPTMDDMAEIIHGVIVNGRNHDDSSMAIAYNILESLGAKA